MGRVRHKFGRDKDRGLFVRLGDRGLASIAPDIVQ